jgi:hypothetical protein
MGRAIEQQACAAVVVEGLQHSLPGSDPRLGTNRAAKSEARGRLYATYSFARTKKKFYPCRGSVRCIIRVCYKCKACFTFIC